MHDAWASNLVRGGAVVCGDERAAVLFVSARTDGNDPVALRIDAACSAECEIDLRAALVGPDGMLVFEGGRAAPALPRIRVDYAGKTYSPWAGADDALAADEVATRLTCLAAGGSPRQLQFELCFDPRLRTSSTVTLLAAWPAAGLEAKELRLHVPYLAPPPPPGGTR